MSNDFESTIESNESNVEKIIEEKENIESSEQSIQRAISSLENDEKVSEILKNNEQQLVNRKAENDMKINEITDQINSIFSQIADERENCMNNRKNIESLAELGEDISDSMAIIEDRSKVLDECENRLQSLLEKLDVQGDCKELNESSNESSISKSESSEIRDSDNTDANANKSGRKYNNYDDKGVQYADENGLKPNIKFELNGYKYKTDDQGRICYVFGKLRLKPAGQKRKNILSTMKEISQGSNEANDQRGHLIADIFDGSNKLGNFIAMDGVLNQGAFKAFEKNLQKELMNKNKLFIRMTIDYDDGDKRPTRLNVKCRKNGANIFRSFSNRSRKR